MYLTSAYKNSPLGSNSSLKDITIKKPDGSKITLAPGLTLEGMTL